MYQSFKRCCFAWTWALVGLLLLASCGREEQRQEPAPTPEPHATASQTPSAEARAPKTAAPPPVADVEVPQAEEPHEMAPRPRVLEPPAANLPGGLGAATPPRPPVSAAPPLPVREGPYRVRPGDTLMNIARKEYGDVRYAKRIYAANRDRIEDPDQIFPGQELRLPKP